jgi:chromosomal replication initiation ATPase DnaA
VSRQLAFDLTGREALDRAAFCVSPANAAALAMIDAWRMWPQGMALLVGPPGAGKSHLAQIWANEAGALVRPAAGLATADLPALVAAPALLLEDADRVAGDPAAEAALFHLHNMARERHLPLLLTARTPPRDWGLALPDLASRMQALLLTRLDPPDDALLAAVLVKLFADRQVVVAPSLIPWLVPRMERSIAAARSLVADLDRKALARGGPITRADAAELVAAPPDDDTPPARPADVGGPG